MLNSQKNFTFPYSRVPWLHLHFLSPQPIFTHRKNNSMLPFQIFIYDSYNFLLIRFKAILLFNLYSKTQCSVSWFFPVFWIRFFPRIRIRLFWIRIRIGQKSGSDPKKSGSGSGSMKKTSLNMGTGKTLKVEKNISYISYLALLSWVLTLSFWVRLLQNLIKIII